MAVEFVHGTLRFLFLLPRVGEFRSNQIGVLTGSALFLLVVYLCEPWLGARNTPEALRIGTLWVGLTLLFEASVGHYALQRSWQSLLADYDPMRGGLMLFGLLFFGLSPAIAREIRRIRRKTA